jgi:hypothetical protein
MWGTNGAWVHPLVVREKLLAPTSFSDEELAVDQVVAADLVTAQKLVQHGRIWRPVRQEPDPDRSVDQDAHEAARQAPPA